MRRSEDAWWGWEHCVTGGGDYAYMQTYKWALTSVTDPHGNAITYTYGRVSNLLNANCFHVSGHADVDLWPETITWAGGRYRVHFSVAARESLDSQFEFAENQIGDGNGAPHQTKKLSSIEVLSNTSNPYQDVSSAWQVIRQYAFTYDDSLTPDMPHCTANCSGGTPTYAPNTDYRKLTLRTITRIGAYDGSPQSLPALPPTTFTYGTSATTATPPGDFNRLTLVNNGQGGTLTFAYATIGTLAALPQFVNNHRVTSKTSTDGRHVLGHQCAGQRQHSPHDHDHLRPALPRAAHPGNQPGWARHQSRL